MKRFLLLLLPLALWMALSLTVNAVLCAFGCKGGATFDDWEEYEL